MKLRSSAIGWIEVSRVRISLGLLLILIASTGIGLGWFMNSIRVQRDAVSAVRQAEGLVLYAKQWRIGAADPPKESGGPFQPSNYLGTDAVDYPFFVSINAGRHPAVLRDVARLRWRLETLYISGNEVSNADMVYVGRLSHLRKLKLAKTSVGDEGIERLERLSELETLDLTLAPESQMKG